MTRKRQSNDQSSQSPPPDKRPRQKKSRQPQAQGSDTPVPSDPQVPTSEPPNSPKKSRNESENSAKTDRTKKAPKKAIDPSGNLATAEPYQTDSLGAAANNFEKYVLARVHRSQLKNAPYNPRVMSDNARDRLKKNIARVGLLVPPVWNRLTGHIVGGHQRIAVLDSLMRTPDYYVRVAVVEFSDKQEREQNIFLNNPEAQGVYDMVKLEQLFSEEQVGFEEAGFTTSEIQDMFGSRPLEAQAEVLEDMAERIRNAQLVYDAMMERPLGDIKNPGFYCVVIFDGPNTMLRFYEVIGMRRSRYIDGRSLIPLLGPDGLDGVPPAAAKGTIYQGRTVDWLCQYCADIPHSQSLTRLDEKLASIRAEVVSRLGLHERANEAKYFNVTIRPDEDSSDDADESA